MDQTYLSLAAGLSSAAIACQSLHQANQAYDKDQPAEVRAKLREAARKLIETLSWIERIREHEET